jgi:Sigma-70, region 4
VSSYAFPPAHLDVSRARIRAEYGSGPTGVTSSVTVVTWLGRRAMGKRGRVFAEARPGIEQRNAEMLRRYKTGENLSSIGASLGFTRERVRQIVRQSGARMPLEYRCAAKDCETAPRAPRRYCYTHQRRLELYSDPLGSRPLLRKQHGTFACYQDGCSCDLCRRAARERSREYEHRVHPEMRRYKARGS